MTPLPTRVSTVLFDLGNTLRHLDHAYVAVISAHAHRSRPPTSRPSTVASRGRC
jgi:FMN phosphatase YigB (HAD superfamily)